MPSLIDHCPSCSGALRIRELHCPTCDITIRGDFDPPTLHGNALTDEQEAFLRLFVLSRGNMSDVERNLGVSYPTVRAKLDDLIAALSQAPVTPTPPTVPAPPTPPTPPEPPVAPQPPAATAESTTPVASDAPLTRTEILQRIADGRLSPDAGMQQLRALGDR